MACWMKPSGKRRQRLVIWCRGSRKTGQQPSEKTEVTLLYDANNLYIGVMCYDSDPDRVLGTLMGRDSILRSDDRIEIVLDTYLDQRNAFYFATNPAGALVDGLVFANGQSDNNWMPSG